MAKDVMVLPTLGNHRESSGVKSLPGARHYRQAVLQGPPYDVIRYLVICSTIQQRSLYTYTLKAVLRDVI